MSVPPASASGSKDQPALLLDPPAHAGGTDLIPMGRFPDVNVRAGRHAGDRAAKS